MDRFFASDTHLGSLRTARQRGFSTVEEHDEAVISSLQSLPKRSKLWILGDVAMTLKTLSLFEEVSCAQKVLLLGNHDKFRASEYLRYFDDIIGPITYKKTWLTHQPMHPQELFGKPNIHGHIHAFGSTSNLHGSYFNVCWDFHRGAVVFEDIVQHFMLSGVKMS